MFSFTDRYVVSYTDVLDSHRYHRYLDTKKGARFAAHPRERERERGPVAVLTNTTCDVISVKSYDLNSPEVDNFPRYTDNKN